VLIGPGPMQTEMGVIEVVVVVKGEEGNDGEKVGVRVGEHFVQSALLEQHQNQQAQWHTQQ